MRSSTYSAKEPSKSTISATATPATSISSSDPGEAFGERALLTGEPRLANCPKGTRLAAEGQPANKNLYIIRVGRVVIANDNGMINDLSCGDYFGETAIREEDATISHQTIVIEEDTVCGVLTQDSIRSIIGDVSRLSKPLPPVASKLDNSYKVSLFKRIVQVKYGFPQGTVIGRRTATDASRGGFMLKRGICL